MSPSINIRYIHIYIYIHIATPKYLEHNRTVGNPNYLWLQSISSRYLPLSPGMNQFISHLWRTLTGFTGFSRPWPDEIMRVSMDLLKGKSIGNPYKWWWQNQRFPVDVPWFSLEPIHWRSSKDLSSEIYRFLFGRMMLIHTNYNAESIWIMVNNSYIMLCNNNGYWINQWVTLRCHKRGWKIHWNWGTAYFQTLQDLPSGYLT